MSSVSKQRRRHTVPEIQSRKRATGAEPIIALTAYDYTMARLVDAAGVDFVLVGDSLGCVVQGNETTIPVTLDEVIYHCRCVSKGCTNALVVGDMPFMSYQVSAEQAAISAGRLMKEGLAQSVKVEGGRTVAPMIEAIVRCGIPVMGHVGLTPQSFHQMGGHKKQGLDRKGSSSADQVLEDALAVQESGAFCCVLEGIPDDLAERITDELDIPTIGIAAGPACDGQILVSYDMLGMNPDFRPKFLKVYRELGSEIASAVRHFRQDVEHGEYPQRSLKRLKAM